MVYACENKEKRSWTCREIWACCNSNNRGYLLYHVYSQFSSKYCFSLFLLLFWWHNGIAGSCNSQHFLSEQTIQTCYGCLEVLFQGSFDSKLLFQYPLRCWQDTGWGMGQRERGVVQKCTKLRSAFQPTAASPRGYKTVCCSASLQNKLYCKIWRLV